MKSAVATEAVEVGSLLVLSRLGEQYFLTYKEKEGTVVADVPAGTRVMLFDSGGIIGGRNPRPEVEVELTSDRIFKLDGRLMWPGLDVLLGMEMRVMALPPRTQES